jgi:hypothetical protein
VRRHIVIVGLFVLVVAQAAGLMQGPSYPSLIPLPANFGPEGIAVGNSHTFYVGSLAPATPAPATPTATSPSTKTSPTMRARISPPP